MQTPPINWLELPWAPQSWFSVAIFLVAVAAFLGVVRIVVTLRMLGGILSVLGRQVASLAEASKGWNAPELKRQQDVLFRLDGEKQRTLADHDRRINSLGHEVDRHCHEIADLRGRVFRIEGKLPGVEGAGGEDA